MAIATKVLECEPQSLEWLTIEDDSGAVWRYAQRGSVDLDTAPHVEGQYLPPVIRATLVRDENGVAVLRQENPGLPEKIVVDYVSSTPQGPMPAMAYWRGKMEYEQESEA